MSAKIHSGDEVIVIRGSNKGKRGKVKRVFSSGKVIIEGLNLVKKHQKPVPSVKKPGGIFEEEAAINIANVAIFNVITNKSDKVLLKMENNRKVRVFRSTGKNIG
ncbi:50S ribosomal protein L24 [Blochmannia endosymbiont of Camponotus (Colobopsis) obliquus]|uniref:50S ribosomal protein L24 n=1 Tax=Blochmannia endosymbiont of Camponotus (Colobopsis) obliquus TaxID=1505597 RepID=UPI00061A530D|nr:50S ribosomal protein L24 [Blochmannia endosymbiont of Camponotus (Colobopsis) obliquus]AKC60372.1 50S ribosomal protein L24 [Blochmannia endosymbiont of Camponotus (Colobopsis) obliquus]